MINLKKILEKTFLKDFVILWSAPIDSPAIKSIKEETAKTGVTGDLAGYIFGNMILGKKS